MGKNIAKYVFVLCGLFAISAALAAVPAAVPAVGTAAGTAAGSTAGSAAGTTAAARDRLLQDIRTWVGVQSAVSADRVEIGPLDARLRIAPCPAGAKLDFPFPARDLVRARCEAPVWQVFIQVSVRMPRNMIVAARPLAAGQVLTEADLATRAFQGAEGLEDRSSVVGRILKRERPQGSPILAQDLEDSVRVIRIAGPLKAGDVLKAEIFRLETLPRAVAPAGAALGVAPAEGSRVVRDLPAGHILLAEELSEARRVLIARQSLAAGQLIESGMFELGLINSRDQTQRYYMEFGGLEFSELARTMQAGEPLRPSDLRPAMLVRRGQSVLLTVGTAGGLQVTLRTEALQDGKLGEQVQLKNPESGRTLSAVVTGKNTARGM